MHRNSAGNASITFLFKAHRNILNGQMKSQLQPESTVCALPTLPKSCSPGQAPEFSRCFLFANPEKIAN